MVNEDPRARVRISGGERVFYAVNTLILLACGIIITYPIWYILIYSLNVGADSVKGGLTLWPRAFTLYSYRLVLGNENIRCAYLITLIRVVAGRASD
jgi:putative aldouronate transport system permease protein